MRQDYDSRSRRGLPWWGWSLMGLLIVLVGAGSFLIVEHSRSVDLGDITPGNEALVASNEVSITASLPGYEPGSGDVVLSVDGTPLSSSEMTLSAEGAQAVLTLEDGPHTIDVAFTSSNIFSRNLKKSATFIVDTTPPTVAVVQPAKKTAIGEEVTRFVFAIDEEATLELTIDGQLLEAAAAEGVSTAGGLASLEKMAAGEPVAYQVDVSTSEGEHTFALTAVDAAGNETTDEWQVWADFSAPVVSIEEWPQSGEKGAAEGTWGENEEELTFTVSDNFAEGLQVTVQIDGTDVEVTPGEAADNQRVFTLETGKLAEGTHQFVLNAEDRGGHVTKFEKEFLVDSASSFGSNDMGPGAVGTDVKQLQDILTAKGFYTGEPTSVYDAATAAAVAAFNKDRGLPAGDRVDKETISMLAGSIVIDLSERKLYHYDEGKLVKTYGIAIGMPSWPTPTGEFHIINKAYHPTWTPPNSSWAKGAKPIPPGPNNPLGTRWMGLNSPGIGIHGTPNPGSIGTAASHGCIRMRISEVEELFERVYVGTPVKIQK